MRPLVSGDGSVCGLQYGGVTDPLGSLRGSGGQRGGAAAVPGGGGAYGGFKSNSRAAPPSSSPLLDNGLR